MGKSSVSRRQSKPQKPYEGFPLFPHATRRWAKKICGKLHYFGKWDDPQAALDRFNREWPYLSQGRTPPPVDTCDGCTVRLLANSFLTSKRNKLESGELAERSFRDYYQTCEMLLDHFGKDRRVDDLRPDDFEGFRKKLAKRFGVVTLKNTVNRCRVVFKFAHDQRLINQPVNYGQSFNRPSAKMLRRARNEAGPRLFEADELRLILDALNGEKVVTTLIDEETGLPKKVTLTADPAMRAMVLLGINCGFGNTDVSSLPQLAVDLENGWVDFPRPKTEIPRRIPLWKESVDVLREAIASRPVPNDPADDRLCFLTAHGNRWVRIQQKKDGSGGKEENERGRTVALDALSAKFGKLLNSLNINGRRGIGFYTLRHVFETIGGESKDQVAVNAIMGHVDSSMAGVYRERISDERLRAVTNTVHAWLFGNNFPKRNKRRVELGGSQ